jgi:hypothetical protein
MTNIVLFKKKWMQTYVCGAFECDSVAKIETLKQSDSKYKFLDNSVLYAMELLVRHLNKKQVGAQMTYSESALVLLDFCCRKNHQEYLKQGRAQTLASYYNFREYIFLGCT